jgi:excisionase family DNA binding protein
VNIRVDLPDEVVDEITAEVTRRVLAELGRTADASPYLTVPEAADLLRCSRQRIDDLLSQRRLTRHKEGRRTLVSRAEIDAYLHTIGPNGR